MSQQFDPSRCPRILHHTMLLAPRKWRGVVNVFFRMDEQTALASRLSSIANANDLQ
jgi:hypothetical protein